MSLVDDLDRLSALQRTGAISQNEFETAKAKLLGAPATAPNVRRRAAPIIFGVCAWLSTITPISAGIWRTIFLVPFIASTLLKNFETTLAVLGIKNILPALQIANDFSAIGFLYLFLLFIMPYETTTADTRGSQSTADSASQPGKKI